MNKRLTLFATAAIAFGMMFSGCEYDPSLYDDYGLDKGSPDDVADAVNETQVEYTLTATVIDNINIRRGPGQDYELIERIGPGPVLTIIGEEENGYYPVDYNGEVGYAYHSFIEINETPSAVETVTEEPESVDGPITASNNETFAQILTLTDEYDERIGQFFNSHIGDEIEFDGYIATFDHHGSYDTRYDVLVSPGDFNDPVAGPLFHFTDVSFVYDMHFDDNTPDYLSIGDEFHFTARIDSYHEATGLVELTPVSSVYRGS